MIRSCERFIHLRKRSPMTPGRERDAILVDPAEPESVAVQIEASCEGLLQPMQAPWANASRCNLQTATGAYVATYTTMSAEAPVIEAL